MGKIFDRLRLKERDDSDLLKPLEDFFEESKRDLEKLRKRPRVRKKIVVVSYNITPVLIAGVICLFLAFVFASYYFLPDQYTPEVFLTTSSTDVKKTEVKSQSSDRLERLRKKVRKE